MNTSTFREERDSVNVLKNALQTAISNMFTSIDNSVIKVLCLMEGENGDFAFYGRFIKKVYEDFENKKIFTFICKDKKSVINCFSFIKNNTREIFNKFNGKFISPENKTQILFFIDKDYSDIINEDIYRSLIAENYDFFFITKYYPIENYFLNKEFFIEFISQYKNYKNRELDEPINNQNNEVQMFEEKVKQFYQNILPLLALIILDRKNSRKLKLNDIPLNIFFNEDMRVKFPHNDLISDFIKSYVNKVFPEDWKNYPDILKKVFFTK